MMSEKQGATPKLKYKTPVLTVYGSVKELTANNSGPNTGDSMNKMTTASDPSLKEQVVRIGEHPAGFGLYLFNYKEEIREVYGYGRQFGVMADEVERVVPEAVSVHEDGYRVVNYALLGIERILH